MVSNTYLLFGTWFDILYHYVYRYKSRKRASLANIFCCTTRIASTFFCSTNQIVAKFVRHASHSIGRSENFYETLSEFLTFCILAVSWDIFRQCDLKKKKTGEIVCLEKHKSNLKKDFGFIVEYWRCWKLRKKVRLTLSFFPLMSFSPNFFHDTAKRRQNWVLYCGLVYKIVLVFTYTLTLLSSSPPPCIY